MDNTRFIYVLLVRYPDLFSRLFRFFARCRYSHASIGISDADGSFYSYVTTGFRKELPLQHPLFRRREVPCKLLRIPISDEMYRDAKTALASHESVAHRFKYNGLGLFLCLLRIVWPMKNQYFCSQFVSEILGDVGAVSLAKHSALYLPDDFAKMNEMELCFTGYLSRMVQEMTARLQGNHLAAAGF